MMIPISYMLMLYFVFTGLLKRCMTLDIIFIRTFLNKFVSFPISYIHFFPLIFLFFFFRCTFSLFLKFVKSVTNLYISEFGTGLLRLRFYQQKDSYLETYLPKIQTQIMLLRPLICPFSTVVVTKNTPARKFGPRRFCDIMGFFKLSQQLFMGQFRLG